MASASSFDETVVDDPWARALYWSLFPVLGAGAGWLVAWASGWIADLPLAPFKAVFGFIARAPEPQTTVVALAVGLVAGLAVAGLAHADMLVIRVGPTAVTLARAGDKAARRTVPKGSVTAAFLDGNHVVLLGADGRELAREKTDLAKKEIAAAFVAQGYPWRADGDPHRDEYRMWTRYEDDLPGAARGLLTDRAAAIERGKADEAAVLREELLKLGVVVRDEKKKQYWRRALP